ncbi:MarR family winged helix-turn-helix transcriptional regulator [Neolewinella antarctica]|uniref:DNA-binding MarR family transcriptional regulator n=1 Tax=Neolewinella antarctica TaxID=442734 RepID=A0ABX0X7Y2_9BACT|nr:MarR family transcriptional regulator [Neolewinella antarctica]NJC25316.1 DNA-binding MarR family transcriptional regulator [Neolewinella antarctica]
MATIEKVIQQAKFSNPPHRAHVNILFTSNWLNHRTATTLKPFGLSAQQFNILRILRGRAGKPATVKLLTERMLDKMSNTSRLVDKLRDKKLVLRQECPTDRRRVDITITQEGLELLGRASHAVEQVVAENFATLTSEDATQLSHLLDKLRGEE